ncbi:MAG: leucyl aminopeptidase, partial [Aestuariivirgaceae bacterium]
ILLIGCGRREKIDARLFRSIAVNAASDIADCGAPSVLSCLPMLPVKRRNSQWKIRQLLETNEHQNYRFDQLKSESTTTTTVPAPGKVVFAVSSTRKLKKAQTAVDHALAIAAGTALAKNLGNLSSNICTPVFLAEQAIDLASKFNSLNVSVLDEDDMKKLGMGALLCVTQGSNQPARLVVVEYRQGTDTLKPIVLVGKGVTFDSGGLSLKPAQAMEDMKFDMAGAASVLGTLNACAQLKLPINLVGIIAAVENMPGNNAVKPGDVVTSMSGRTVEILNTDAEGRLALCDALTYAKRFDPGTVIDIATLTGACVVALGKHPHGLFSNSDSLTDELITAGRRSHDRPWPMPLWPEYQSSLNSKVADIANIGGSGAGAITAACFLARFTRDMRWAHLD